MDLPFSSGQYGSMDGGDLSEDDSGDINTSTFPDHRLAEQIHRIDSLKDTQIELCNRVTELEVKVASLMGRYQIFTDLRNRVERFDLK